MNKIILQNIISFIGATLLCISTFSKQKKSILLVQVGDCAFSALAEFIAGSYSGCITSILAGVRDGLNAFGRVSKIGIIIFSVLLFGIGLAPIIVFNQTDNIVFQVLPPIAAVQYTVWTSLTKSPNSIRTALIINTALWGIHAFGMKLYPSFIMCVIVIATSIINNIRYRDIGIYTSKKVK